MLVRRKTEHQQEIAHYRFFAPAHTILEQRVAVAGKSWAIEECFEMGKGEVGLDQPEVRTGNCWYRHIVLAMLAQAYLTVAR